MISDARSDALTTPPADESAGAEVQRCDAGTNRRAWSGILCLSVPAVAAVSCDAPCARSRNGWPSSPTCGRIHDGSSGRLHGPTGRPAPLRTGTQRRRRRRELRSGRTDHRLAVPPVENERRQEAVRSAESSGEIAAGPIPVSIRLPGYAAPDLHRVHSKIPCTPAEDVRQSARATICRGGAGPPTAERSGPGRGR